MPLHLEHLDIRAQKMGEQSGGREKIQLSSFSYATTLNTLGLFWFVLFLFWSCFFFFRIHINFCADQPNTTYSETMFCKSVAVDSILKCPYTEKMSVVL